MGRSSRGARSRCRGILSLSTPRRNDDEELVEELGFEEVRPTRRLGKDPLPPLKARRRRVGVCDGGAARADAGVLRAHRVEIKAPSNLTHWLISTQARRSISARRRTSSCDLDASVLVALVDVFMTWVKLNDERHHRTAAAPGRVQVSRTRGAVLENELVAGDCLSASLLYEGAARDFDATSASAATARRRTPPPRALRASPSSAAAQRAALTSRPRSSKVAARRGR